MFSKVVSAVVEGDLGCCFLKRVGLLWLILKQVWVVVLRQVGCCLFLGSDVLLFTDGWVVVVVEGS